MAHRQVGMSRTRSTTTILLCLRSFGVRLASRDQIDHAASPPSCWPMVDDDVRQWMHAVVDRLGEIPTVIAVCLHGSLAVGSFHRPTSDVDLLAIVENTLDQSTRRELAVDVLDLFDRRPIVGGLEFSVVRRHFLEPFTHPAPYEFHFSERWAENVRGGASGPVGTDRDLAAHFTMARLRGVALLGPPPLTVVGHVPHEAYIDAILDDARWIIDGGIVESPVYGVLNLCRIIQVVRDDPELPPSKEEGANWAKEHLPVEHHSIVADALECYRSRAQIPTHLRRVHGHRWDPGRLRALAAHAREELQRHL